jgi:2-oxoglutarate dehydrogenase E1 component
MDLDFILRANPSYIDELYEQYRLDPCSVGDDWAHFFAGFEFSGQNTPSETHSPGERTVGVFDLIHSYRELGHLIADLDPLGGHPTSHPLLELREFGFTPDDLNRHVQCPSLKGRDDCTLQELIDVLKATYCGTLGVEYMYIDDKTQREWLQEQMEPSLNRPDLSPEDCRHVLAKTTSATGFEQFLHAKYVGQKRFSLEGAETLIPFLDTLIEECGEYGIEEIIAGMSHRGRLNVLANILGKPCEMIFSEFEGHFLPKDVAGDGDVKYHLGYARDHTTRSGRTVHVSLLSNPSHLEAVDPVVEGIVRAKQRYRRDTEGGHVMPLLLHGDAAFTGQGIVAETLALSELPAYRTGGSVHVIINNRVGFTASPADYCFTRYPSDIGKFIQAPVFHVNGNDPEAAVQAARLAARFRHRFKVDVIIDLVCYRLHGHNEADDPTFTHPAMYRKIAQQKSACELYAARLAEKGVVAEDTYETIRREQREIFDAAIDYARDFMPRQQIFALGGVWAGMSWAGDDWSAATSVSHQQLVEIADRVRRLPDDFNPHPRVVKLLNDRREMLEEDSVVDWGCAEMLALGSLLLEGVNVRLTGQDSGRGTFSHRHAVLTDQKTDATYIPLEHLKEDQGWVINADSMLSEAAALGFEYGFSSADPRNLVLWEAQFGDFANGAQIAIDQFIASAESKWQRMSGLVMLLPHGYEGQGPEHSSARLERYLQLCAENNMQVCNLTTPAQYFHALRMQMHRSFRKPLILMTPKSLLRHRLARSPAAALSNGVFQNVISETHDLDHAAVRRVLLCSGKIYYDLLTERDQRQIADIAIVRIERLYPFPEPEIAAELAAYASAREVFWVQEEPWNMGAWQFMATRFAPLLGIDRELTYVGRDEAASPATGSYKLHIDEQTQILNSALRLPDGH